MFVYIHVSVYMNVFYVCLCMYLFCLSIWAYLCMYVSLFVYMNMLCVSLMFMYLLYVSVHERILHIFVKKNYNSLSFSQ
jgi:hypothetical protein